MDRSSLNHLPTGLRVRELMPQVFGSIFISAELAVALAIVAETEVACAAGVAAQSAGLGARVAMAVGSRQRPK